MSVTSRKLTKMPAEAINLLRSQLGLSDRDLRGALDTDQRTLGRWLTGETFPQREARQRLSGLMALYQRLIETFGDAETARQWLHSPSRYLGRLKPVDAIRAGCFTEVEAAIEAFESGVHI